MSGTDAELVRAAREGERGAFETLVQRHVSRVGAVCWAGVGAAGPVEDLVQETFLRALRALDTLEDEERFAAWVAGIARRACADWSKARSRTERTADSLTLDRVDVAASVDPAEHREERELLRAAVLRLPPIYRETLVMFYFAGRSYRAIAGSLGITEAAVNVRLTRARAMLGERLGPVLGARDE